MNMISKYISKNALMLSFLSILATFSGFSFAAKPKGKSKPQPPAASCEKAEKSVQALFGKFLDMKNDKLSWVCTVDKVVKSVKDNKCTKYNSLIKELENLRGEKNATKILKTLQGRGAFLDLLLNQETAAVLDNYSMIQAINLMQKRIGLNGKVSC